MNDRPLLRLRFLHARLDREVDREQRRRAPDSWRIQRLKKLKLAIRDRLARLGRQSLPA